MGLNWGGKRRIFLLIVGIWFVYFVESVYITEWLRGLFVGIEFGFVEIVLVVNVFYDQNYFVIYES